MKLCGLRSLETGPVLGMSAQTSPEHGLASRLTV
jgi:hypothetical protein